MGIPTPHFPVPCCFPVPPTHTMPAAPMFPLPYYNHAGSTYSWGVVGTKNIKGQTAVPKPPPKEKDRVQMKPNNQQLCGPGRGGKVVSSRKSQDLTVLEGLAKLVV